MTCFFSPAQSDAVPVEAGLVAAAVTGIAVGSGFVGWLLCRRSADREITALTNENRILEKEKTAALRKATNNKKLVDAKVSVGQLNRLKKGSNKVVEENESLKKQNKSLTEELQEVKAALAAEKSKSTDSNSTYKSLHCDHVGRLTKVSRNRYGVHTTC